MRATRTLTMWVLLAAAAWSAPAMAQSATDLDQVSNDACASDLWGTVALQSACNAYCAATDGCERGTVANPIDVLVFLVRDLDGHWLFSGADRNDFEEQELVEDFSQLDQGMVIEPLARP